MNIVTNNNEDNGDTNDDTIMMHQELFQSDSSIKTYLH